jgi:tetratricopeptide (TPR) repeat protein
MRACVQIALVAAGVLVVATASESIVSVIDRARKLIALSQFEAAEKVLRGALVNSEQSAELHGELGALLYRNGRFREAVPELGRAAQLDPDSPGYSIQLAGAIIGDGRFSVALDLLKALRPRFESLADYHYNLGLAYYGMHNYRSAIPAFEKVVELAPKHDLAQFFLGNCHAVSGDPGKAAAQYRRAIELNPGNPSYYLALGKVVGQMGPEHNAESMRVLRKALDLKPGDIPSQFALGLACERAGDMHCAAPLLEQVVARYPDELPPHVALARVYAKLKDHERAAREREIVKKLGSIAMQKPSRTDPFLDPTTPAPVAPQQ